MQNRLETPAQFQDPEEKIRLHLQDFRRYLCNFAERENEPDLRVLNFDDITEEDMVFFQRFQMGMFHLNDIERQERVLENMPEAETSRKLLAYMRKKLTKSEEVAA